MNSEKKKLKIPLPSVPPDLIAIVCVITSVLLFVTGYYVPVAAELKTFVFACCVVLTSYDVIIDTVTKGIKERAFNENLLVIIAAVIAFLIGKSAEGAAVMIIFSAGKVAHRKYVERSAKVIENLIDLRPEVVNAVINGAIVQMSPGKIKAGDTISVSPGELVSLDGVVINGQSDIYASCLEGEAMRVTVTEGSEVRSGSVNLTGVLNIRVTADFDHSTISRILKIVENAVTQKSVAEKMIRRFARLFAPAAVAAALIIGVAVPLLAGLSMSVWLSRALGFLAVFNPAGLIAATALTYFACIGGAALKGILFKSANVVDNVANTTSVIFDKTGTLTDGKYEIIDINAYGIPDKRLLMLAAYAELNSNHPIARSIVAAASAMPDFTRVSDYREFAGKGAEVEIDGNVVSAGNALFLTELGITPDISQSEASVVYIAVNGKYAGRILLSDAVKPDAKKAVKDLHAMGIDRIAVFTGETKEVAAAVATQLDIKEFYAECLPGDKITRLKGLLEMQLAGDKLLFVGDGLDDAQVLQMADAGVTIGGFHSDEAILSADMLVMTDEPSKIASAITLARYANKISRQNIMLFFGVKGLILLLMLLGIATLWVAVLADACLTMLAVVNAMRAYGLTNKEIRQFLPKKKKEEVDMASE